MPFPATATRPEVDLELLGRMRQSGPRYTSYPTADRFDPTFRFGDYLEAAARLRHRASHAPLSLYIHVPFCESLCYYCACNKIITRDHSKAETYLEYLKQEATMQGHLYKDMGRVEQLHFGGGTPTFLSNAQLEDLMAHLRENFKFAPDAEGEYSIEIDPRTVDAQRIVALRMMGFNRISLGVQDFDPKVQEAVNRIQPAALTFSAIAAARLAGYRSISIDLIYGLPMQTLETMAATLQQVVDADPDRISIYHYAHMPHIFKSQRQMREEDMPGSADKLAMLAMCVERLTAAGYVYIGMDHFAKPDDELAIALRQGRLHRNFQGYSTHAEADMVSMGVSAISSVGNIYSQNEKSLESYYAALDEGRLPIARGMRLSTDDLLRRVVIQSLMCQFELPIDAIEQTWQIHFGQYFASELAQLKSFADDGLIEMEPDWIAVTPKGRLLVRNICMVFDRYLAMPACEGPQPIRFSRTV